MNREVSVMKSLDSIHNYSPPPKHKAPKFEEDHSCSALSLDPTPLVEKIMGNIFSYPFVQEYMVDRCKSVEKGLETLDHDMFSSSVYDDIHDELWYNDVIPMEFDRYNNDDILEYMKACSESDNSNKDNEEVIDILGLNRSLVLLQKDDELVEVEADQH